MKGILQLRHNELCVEKVLTKKTRWKRLSHRVKSKGDGEDAIYRPLIVKRWTSWPAYEHEVPLLRPQWSYSGWLR